MLTVAIAGTEGVMAFFSGDPKACLTVSVAIDAVASKLHVRIVAMKKAHRDGTRFRVRYETEIAETRVFVIYKTFGWTTQQISLDYLEWLAEHVIGPMVLLWDLFATHRKEVVNERASTLCVRFVFVPSGMAGRCEPPDKRIFSSMKRRVTW
jgi:hypothetical protein